MTRWKPAAWACLSFAILSHEGGWCALSAAAEDAKQAAATSDPNSLVEPYTPPTLAELDAKAEWITQPVQDQFELLREQLAKEPPLVTPQQALSLVNNSSEANAKILSALGRLPTADSQVNWDGTINRHLRGDVKSTNPLLASSLYESYVEHLTTTNLIDFDWNLRPYGASESIVSWQTSKDHLCDKFVLRDDWTWSDGQPVTAHDVVFSFRAIMNPKVPAIALRTNTQEIRWVEAYDDRTVVFFHKRPLATNVWNMSYPLIPKHIYEKSLAEDPTLQDSAYHVKYENDPVLCGPYVVTSRKRGQETVLARRESYYMQNGKQVRPKPYFKEVRFKIIEDTNTALLALKSGRIDEMELMPEQWTNQTSDSEFTSIDTKVSGVEWAYYYIGWNNKSPWFSDRRVREAMSYAFDHEEMQKLTYGLYQPCTGIFHPTSWMMTGKPLPKIYKQDLDKAEELLEQAGWIDHDGDGIRDKTIDGKVVSFEFTVLVHNSPDRIKLCTLLKQNLKQIGVAVNVRPMEMTVLFDILDKHTYDAYFAGWSTGSDPEEDSNVWTTDAQTTGRNYLLYSNPQVDALFDEGKREFDRAKRAEIYAKINNLIYQDQPCTFLYYRSSFYGFNKELRGYRVSPRNPYGYNPGSLSLWRAAPQ